MINPRNAAAQRGMAILPALLPVSPFPEPEPPVPAVPEPAFAAARSAAPAPATAPSVVRAPQADSLLGLLMEPDPPAGENPPSGPRHASDRRAAAPASASNVLGMALTSPYFAAQQAPLNHNDLRARRGRGAATAGAPSTPSSGGYSQEVVDFVVREYGRHRSRDEIIRALSEQHHLAWGVAQELMAKVEQDHRKTIAVRQNPFFIFLGIATIIGGCVLAARGGFILYYMYHNATELGGMAAIPDPRALWFGAGQLITGIAMVLGATIGLGQTIKELFK